MSHFTDVKEFEFNSSLHGVCWMFSLAADEDFQELYETTQLDTSHVLNAFVSFRQHLLSVKSSVGERGLTKCPVFLGRKQSNNATSLVKKYIHGTKQQSFDRMLRCL